jgi:hypothetical protein
LALGKKIIIVKNTTAYTWDWYCHLVVDVASLYETLAYDTKIYEKKKFCVIVQAGKIFA